MKNTLLYNYNLEPSELKEEKDGSFSFYIDYDKYYFIKVQRPLDDIRDIFEIVKNSREYHRFVFNKFQSIITESSNEMYVLLKAKGPENGEIDITDILKGADKYEKKTSTLNRTDWGNLWSEKVDYLEYQVSELSSEHKIVRKSFSYYVGLAENAIEYFNLLDTKDLPTVVSHRRMKYPFISKRYADPLEIVLDYRPRDIASYFKTKFFEESNPIAEVRYLTNKKVLSPLEYNLLFCRLLYPSYYFDGLKRVLEDGEEDDTLLKYITKVNDYERFLNEVYEIFKEKSSMIKIDWLIKKS